MSLVGFFKKLFFFVLIVAITIPLRYGSTNPKYLLIRLLHSTLSLKHSLISDPDRPTLSADYRGFENIFRLRPIPNPDPLADPLPIIKKIRPRFLIGTIIPKPSQCEVNKEIFEHDGHTVDAYWVDLRQQNVQKESDKILLYFHGGGYILGDINGYSGIECHLSKLFNMSVLHVEYRLSPEHPLPAAVEDTITVYRALLRKNISPTQLFIMGDSAGGGLALLTVQAIINHQLPVPQGVIALSPWTDLSLSSESYTRNHLTDVMLSTEYIKWMAKLVMGTKHTDLSPTSPVFSPLFGSFRGFPPMYINVGTAEIVEDDSRKAVKKAEEAGVDVTFEIGLHMMHGYPAFFSYFPEAQAAVNNIKKWIQKVSNENHNE